MKARTGTRFRSFRLVIAPILAALVAILALPGAASAATNPGFVTVPVTHLSDGSLLVAISDDFNVGDCTQFRGSNVRLSVPDVNGFVLVVWTAAAQTRHTNNADIWHQVVGLRTTTGFQTVNVGNMDGDPMRKTFTRYSWQRTALVKVNPAAFAASGTATLTGRC
jgi:hypothetical protein